MRINCVIDSSALLALIHNEPGAEVVKPLLSSAAMSTINLSESLAVLQRASFEVNETIILINDIIKTIISFDIIHAAKAAELTNYTKNKGLSLGDRACIALGIELGVPIYTADKIWAELELEKAIIRLIR